MIICPGEFGNLTESRFCWPGESKSAEMWQRLHMAAHWSRVMFSTVISPAFSKRLQSQLLLFDWKSQEATADALWHPKLPWVYG